MNQSLDGSIDGVEDALQRSSQRGNTCDQHSGDQSDEQAVFNHRSAGLVIAKFVDQSFHDSYPFV